MIQLVTFSLPLRELHNLLQGLQIPIYTPQEDRGKTKKKQVTLTIFDMLRLKWLIMLSK